MVTEICEVQWQGWINLRLCFQWPDPWKGLQTKRELGVALNPTPLSNVCGGKSGFFFSILLNLCQMLRHCYDRSDSLDIRSILTLIVSAIHQRWKKDVINCILFSYCLNLLVVLKRDRAPVSTSAVELEQLLVSKLPLKAYLEARGLGKSLDCSFSLSHFFFFFFSLLHSVLTSFRQDLKYFDISCLYDKCSSKPWQTISWQS